MWRFCNLSRALRFWTLLSLVGFFSVEAWAQSGTLRGFVYDKATGEPILFTNVFLAGTTIGSSTDV
ncbi:MAG: hypothetical protein ACKO18_09100, partial [Bacteroidota bacterium]